MDGPLPCPPRPNTSPLTHSSLKPSPPPHHHHPGGWNPYSAPSMMASWPEKGPARTHIRVAK